MSDETPPPDGDWAFPPVVPAVGPTGDPAGPVPAVGSTNDPAGPVPVAATTADPAGAAPPPADAADIPVPGMPDRSTPDWSTPLNEPPSAGVMPVPRRAPSAAPPVSPLRAVAGAAVAVAGVLLGIGALLWATDAPKGTPTLQAGRAQTASVSSPSPVPPSPTVSPAAVTPVPSPLRSSPAAQAAAAPKLALTVLNNSNRTGLAKRAAARYAAAGWPIKLTGSFRGRVTETTVYFAPGQQASAIALQKAFPAIARVRPRFAGLPGSGLTVVLVRTYPA